MHGSQLGAAITEQAFFATQSFIVNTPVFSAGEATQIAKGKFNDMIIDFITGEGTAIGNTDIRAGRVIELLKLGQRFSGLYYVTSSTHSVDQSGYITQFTVERNAT
jgi:phage protein D